MDPHKLGQSAGNRGKGRPKGVPNKATASLKAAILAAAEQHGEDGEGRGGLQGYLFRVASEDVKAFASLLGRILPTEVTGANGGEIKTVTRIVLEAAADDDGAG